MSEVGRIVGRRSAEARRSGRLLEFALAALLAATVLLPPWPFDPGQAAGAQPAQEDVHPPAQAPAALPPLDGAATAGFDPAAVTAALQPLLADPDLGSQPGAVVLDAVTGQTLLDVRASTPLAPASSLKIATGLAVLKSLGPQERLATSVVRDVDGSLVLIGGGDPTLRTVPAAGGATPYPEPATLAELAELTAKSLTASGVPQVALRFDAGLFAGPALSPDWDPTFVGLGIVSPVSALTVDPASEGIDGAALDADPALAAASWFAARVQSLGITVTSVTPGTASAEADPVASVASAPISAIVDRMLDISDNDVAEALFRLAAIGRGLPASFDGGTAAVLATLEELGAPAAGLVVRDGSGLSRSNRISPLTLAAALRPSADPAAAELVAGAVEDASAGGQPAGAITWLPSGLPVGGLTGSLSARFDTDQTASGAGRVHAKTGTLTGVTSLTGLVATLQGRPAVFAVLSNETPNTTAARDALDSFAAALAACGCAAKGS